MLQATSSARYLLVYLLKLNFELWTKNEKAAAGENIC